MAKATSESIIRAERIAAHIYLVRGKSVMLDSDLAALYEVPARALNQAVSRNEKRFPEDFCFRLSWEEYDALRSQIVTLESGGRGRRRKYPPRAFTRERVALLSSVLRSDRAAEVNIGIMRTFVKLREMLATNEELARKVAQHDQEIAILFEHIQGLLEPPDPPKRRRIGFAVSDWEQED